MATSDVPPVPTSSPGGLVTATYLAALRRARDLSLNQAAEAAGMSGFDLHCLEGGGPGLVPDTITRLLGVYEVAGLRDVEAVTRLLDAPATGDMLRDSGPGCRDRLVACEQASRTIRMWTAVWLPGLVQTPEYAAVAAECISIDTEPGPVPLERRRLSPLSLSGPQVVLLIDEFVLRRPIGGAAVMAGQLAYLQTLVEARVATVRVVPADCEIQPLGSHFAELELASARLYVDKSLGISYATDSPPSLHPSRYRAQLDALETAAVSPEESYAWLGRARSALVHCQEV